jgi:glycosyltransferase involved in cell wall biosynthesis
MPEDGTTDLPKVSCLMVTANRRDLCRRSIRCYNRQTYPNRELVVVDDGEQDLTPALKAVPDDELVYVPLDPDPSNFLGRLRNVTLEAANGEILTQWDDDDWYHPERIEKQARVLQNGYDACCLYGALMHIDSEKYVDHPYVGYLEDGVPGSIMHRRSQTIRYPEIRRAEDTVYLDEWRAKRYTMLPGSEAHLFIRCFHGSNTWEKKHFLTRMRNTVPDALAYVWHRFVRGDLFQHPRFHLTDEARRAFEMYLNDSRDLDLLETPVH